MKLYKFVTLLFLVAAYFALPSLTFAKTEIVYASYKYVMGDNDTKNDAKRICFLEAKRRCLEKVGSYVESITEVQNYRLTKDEIKSYTAAIVKVEVVSEKISFEGQSVVINTKVKAEVDADHTRKELQRIAGDKGLQARIKEQQNQIDSLESKIRKLQAELHSSSYKKSFKLREAREQTFDDLYVETEKMKKIVLAKRARDAERPKIVAEKTKIRRLVLKYVEIGMTPEEVNGIIKEITIMHRFQKVDSIADLLGIIMAKENTTKNAVYYEWEKIWFEFELDEYLEQYILKSINYKLEQPFKTPYKTRIISSCLKRKGFNILDVDCDEYLRKRAKEIEKIKKKRAKERQPVTSLDLADFSGIDCSQEIREYIWGEE